MAGDPAIEAAWRALIPIKAGTRTVGEHIAFGLACWCPLDQPCHADVLLELANAGHD